MLLLLTGCDQVFGLNGNSHPDATLDTTQDAPEPPRLLVQQITNGADSVPFLSATLPAPTTPGHVLVMVGSAVSDQLALRTAAASPRGSSPRRP